MSTSTAPGTYSELFTDLQNRVRDATSVTATQTIAKRMINTGLQDMHIGNGEKFPWAERSAILITHPKYTEGTVAINTGSTTLTGTETLWNTANAYQQTNFNVGGRLTINGGVETYEVSAIASDTSITLASVYVGTPRTGSITAYASSANTKCTSVGHGLVSNQSVTITGTTSYNGVHTVTVGSTDDFEIDVTFVADEATGTWETSAVSGVDYVYFEDEYALATDFLRPIDAQHFDTNGSIELVGRTEFNRRCPRNSTLGDPSVATIVDRAPAGNTTPRRRLRLWRPSEDAEMIPYSYVTNLLATSTAGVAQTALSADNDEPIVPLRYRHAIVLWGLKTWYRDRNDDARFQSAEAEYQDLLMRIVGDHEVGQKHPQIRPAVSRYVRRARRPWGGGGGGRFDMGHFDEMGQ